MYSSQRLGCITSPFQFGYCTHFSIWRFPCYHIDADVYKRQVLSVAFPYLPLVEPVDILTDVLVEFVEVDIRQYWTDNTALRRAAVRLSLIHIYRPIPERSPFLRTDLGTGTLQRHGVERRFGGTEAVSYTHLDVYKRQQPDGFVAEPVHVHDH